MDGPRNVMTVDVEDYFHVSALAASAPRDRWPAFESRVEASTGRLLDLFDEAGVTVTCFVLGWVADRHPDLVRAIAARGHEVASHGYWHQLVYDLSPEGFREDVRRSKGLLEDLSGQAVAGYRAPSFSITRRSLWALDVLIEEGYTYDTSIFPVRHDRYGIADAPRLPYRVTRPAGTIVEVPPATVRLAGQNLPVAGGGYFRLLPYAWHRLGIGRLNRTDKAAAVFYLHPWEIDPGQPRLPASAVSRFRHYTNLHRTEGRLRRLLHDAPFGSMRQMLETLGPLPAVALEGDGIHAGAVARS
jgi:polysaccharide deacetylase family protein (PEP-CTERM system associated)